jgi:phosphoglycerate dehydrogenase-like enzyme
MPRVVILEDYLDYARQLPCVQALAQRVELQIYTAKAESEAETVARTRGADIVITIRDRVHYTPSLLAQLGHLQLLSVCGARLSHIDLDAATRHGVLICAPSEAAQGGHTKAATAEQTWHLILGLIKETVMHDSALRQGQWQTRPSRGLVGKTLGLVGLGAIGQQVAQIGNAMRMRVVAWSPHLTPERARAHGAECVAFAQLLRESDIVSLHAPMSPENRDMLGEHELHLMRPHAYLINTARAALVNEQALRQALERGTIAGAGLDVYWEEPLPVDHWLRRQQNVLLQPHLGGFTDEGYASLLMPAVDNVIAFLDGAPRNLVNPQAVAVGMRPSARGRLHEK